MNSMGGFLPVEKSLDNQFSEYHSASLLSNARSCFSLIIKCLSPKSIYFPDYICSCMRTIIENSSVKIISYSVDESLEGIDLPEQLQEGEYVFYVNYFGINDQYVEDLIKTYKSKLIIDDSQAFFRANSGIETSFNSIRKFFGVSDGAYLYSNCTIDTDNLARSEFDTEYLYLRNNSDDSMAYEKFLNHESKISDVPRRVSLWSEQKLNQIDYPLVAKRRRENFDFLNSALSGENKMKIRNDSYFVPLYFPYLSKEVALKKRLLQMGIYVPTLWAELTEKRCNSSWEQKLIQEMCLLPVDQRYTVGDMEYIVNRI